MNKPIINSHVNEIAKYLIETENYILPPFIFNSNTPIRVHVFGIGAVKYGYAVIPTNVKLYVTDGQHRLKAIEKAIEERPSLGQDAVTALVIQEADMDQIHQDFADCAKNKPISQTVRASFDTSDPLSRMTRTLSKDLEIFKGRIDQISSTIGTDPAYLFTMSQLKSGIAEFIFGKSGQKKLGSRSAQGESDFFLILERAKSFYAGFARKNDKWMLLLQPMSQPLNLHVLRQQRVDFNSVGLQVISRVGHRIFFGQEFTERQREDLIQALASLDYSRNSELWQNSIVIDDNGNKKIVTQTSAVDKAFKVARDEVNRRTGIILQ